MARTVEELLNPSLKVSRPVSACKKCRSAKIKCDGKLPACTACERAGKADECSSANDEFARGKERSYVSALELAAQRLQRRIDERKSQTMVAGRPGLQRRPVSITRRKEATSVDALVEDLSFLALNATSRDFQGFSATMSFARMLKAIAIKKHLPDNQDTTLPPRHTITPLIDQYFDHVHVLSPFLSETEFHSAVSRVYVTQQNAQHLAFDQWCFRLVLATASASLCQIKGDEHYHNAMKHAGIAMDHIEHVIHPGSIAGIQALLLLTQFSLVDPEHFDSWYLVGMAARLCVDLGLHCEPAPEIKISKHALDQRRRIFYCAYALDRLIAMSLGFAFSFTDDSAPNVLLPTLATDQEARSPSQLFTRSIRPSLFLFDVRRVQSSYYQSKNCSSRKEWTAEATQNYISSTLEDVNSWHSTLSSSFSEAILQVFYLEYLYTQVLVLSPSTVSPASSLSENTRVTFFNSAVQYAQQMSTMLQRQDLQTCLNYADFCRARSVAKQFQSVMWADFDGMIKSSIAGQGSSPLANCTNALAFLSNMSQVLEWPKQRWDIAALKISFERESAVLLARLQTRQQEYAARQVPSPPVGYQSRHNSAQDYMQEYQPPMMNNMQGYTNQHQPSVSTNYDGQQNPSMSQMQGYPSQQGLSSSMGAFNQQQSSGNMPAFSSQQSFSSNAHVPHYAILPPPVPSDHYAHPAVHRSNLVRASEWDPTSEHVNSDMPLGSLPRRNYQFMGGPG